MNDETGELTDEDDVTGGERLEEISQIERPDEANREKHGVESRDKVKHIERNDQLFVTRMMFVTEQG